MNNLKGKTALITGGASGLGKAIAERFAAEGATIVIADINEPSADAGYFISTDVTNAAAVRNMIEQTVLRTQRLDILVNNAGTDGAQMRLHEYTPESWRQVVDLNLNAVFYGMKYGLEQLLRQGNGGVIINMSSIAGLIAFTGAPAYCATKAAVTHLTKAAALEYGPHNIRINAIAPTAVMTPLLEQHIRRSPDPAAMKAFVESTNMLPGILHPEDIAAAALYLAGDESRYVSGITLPVDGAYSTGKLHG
jgi:NAD(P)-dependent dehydrogenase (short-subunit alcohol dehydrogenase family)